MEESLWSSDHRPLVYLFGLTDPSTRLIKFRLALEEYNLEVIYQKGSENVVADALSRISIQDLQLLHEKMVLALTRSKTLNKKQETDERPDQPTSKPVKQLEVVIKNINELKISPDTIAIPRKGTRLDLRAKLSKVMEYAKQKEYDFVIIKNNENELLKVINDIKEAGLPNIIILGEKVKIIKDEKERLLILNDYHILPTAGHAGIARTLATIQKKYFWQGMRQDVEKFIKTCPQCQKYKVGKPDKPLSTVTTTAGTAFEKIYLDLVGPLVPTDGYEYILTTQCELTKYVTATPIKNKSTQTVAKAFVENIILKFGVPKRIATDRGTEFMSELFTSIAKLLNIEKLNSTAYHHQSIGALENSHKALGNFLRIYCNDKLFTWVHWVPYYEFAFNNTVHSITNYTPFYLVFGKSCNMPSNLSETDNPDPIYNIDDYNKQLKFKLQTCHKEVKEKLIQEKTKRTEKINENLKQKLYKPKDLILLKNETGKKLDQKFLGPFEIIEDLEPNVSILINGKKDIVHKSRIKEYK